MSNNLKVFIGWDSREDEAYKVARSSILRHNPNVEVYPLKLYELKAASLYARPADTAGSTEFTISRFLAPALCYYEGYSLFMDCDVVATTDITKIMDEADLTKTVNCVQHDYESFDSSVITDVKMDGKVQSHYPRKNWSSVMLFNNAKCEMLTPGYVNSATPKELHRMEWANEDIGELHHRWNYLAGYYNDDDHSLIHWTDGGPWFENYRDCPLNEIWYNELFHLYGIHERFERVMESMK